MNGIAYSQLMGEQSAVLTLKIDTEEPVELGDFVGAFTSIANEFERFVSEEHPRSKSDPKMFVREVRYGCIEADIISGLAVAAVTHMDQILILEDFVKRWGRRFSYLMKGSVPAGELETSSELKDWVDAVKSISSDPRASHRIEAAQFEDGERKVRAAFTFTAPDARTALENIEDRKKLIKQKEIETHERVLMIFTRTDIHDAKLNKKSGERVVIGSLSSEDKPVMYASEIAEQEIREHIREADENAYKRGFVVDIAMQKSGDSISAYAVTALHSVIDID